MAGLRGAPTAPKMADVTIMTPDPFGAASAARYGGWFVAVLAAALDRSRG